MNSFDLISNPISLIVGAALGWYIKGRGWFGVKVDASNAVKEAQTVVSEVKSA